MEVSFVLLHLKPPLGSCVLDLTYGAGVAAAFCASCQLPESRASPLHVYQPSIKSSIVPVVVALVISLRLDAF